jgi:hypothetical protein
MSLLQLSKSEFQNHGFETHLSKECSIFQNTVSVF